MQYKSLNNQTANLKLAHDMSFAHLEKMGMIDKNGNLLSVPEIVEKINTKERRKRYRAWKKSSVLYKKTVRSLI